MSTIRLLAISGSLRAGSSNRSLLEAARALAPDGSTIDLYADMAALPHFNPDVESSGILPAEAVALRALVSAADGLLISTPEYAHGLPGSFKNVLDWLVGAEDFAGKPVALVTPSARSVYAQEQARLVLTTMAATFVDAASVVIPLPSRETSADAIIRDPALAGQLRSALDELISVIRDRSGDA